jgi:DNA repair exonuclease SbcCD ATPase subunit
MSLTKKEIIFEKLMGREYFKEIKKISTGTPLYEALSKYWPEAEKQYNEISRQIQEQLNKERVITKSVTELEANQEFLNNEIKRKAIEKERLESTVNSLKAQLHTLQTNLETREKELRELRERGATEEIIRVLNEMDFIDKQDILGRIKTLNEYLETKKLVQSAKENLDGLLLQIEEKEKTLEETEDQLNNTRKELEEIRQQTKIQGTISIIVTELLAQGYDPQLIKALQEAINQVAEATPQLTSRSVIAGYQRYGTLTRLEAEIREKEAQRKQLEEALDEARGIYKAIQEDAIKNISQIKDFAELSITESSKEIVKIILESVEQIQTDFKTFIEQQEKTISLTTIENTNTIQSNIQRTKEQFQSLLTRLDESWKKLEKDLEKWGELRQQIGAYEEQIKLGYILYGIEKYPEAFNALKIEEVAPLVSRINNWTMKNLNGVKTRPSMHVARMCPNLYSIYDYELIAITNLLNEEFYKRVHHQ